MHSKQLDVQIRHHVRQLVSITIVVAAAAAAAITSIASYKRSDRALKSQNPHW